MPAGRYTNPDVDVAFPAAEDYGLILTLGAPWSVARRNAWIEGNGPCCARRTKRGRTLSVIT